MNNSKYQLFIIKNGRSGLRCAVFYHEHGLYCCEVSGMLTMKAVVMATKTVVVVMKTVFMPVTLRICFAIFGFVIAFVFYRRFSGSWGFSSCLFPCVFCDKETFIFCFLPISVFYCQCNSGLNNQNVRLDWAGILSEIEIAWNGGYCDFFPSKFLWNHSVDSFDIWLLWTDLSHGLSLWRFRFVQIIRF